MKKQLLTICLMWSIATVQAFALDRIDLVLRKIENIPPNGGGSRTPVLVPSASLNGNTFCINGGHADYVVQLLGEDDNVVYQTAMPSDVSSIELPSYLSGDYQIQLLWGGWMFYGWISL